MQESHRPLPPRYEESHLVLRSIKSLKKSSIHSPPHYEESHLGDASEKQEYGRDAENPQIQISAMRTTERVMKAGNTEMTMDDVMTDVQMQEGAPEESYAYEEVVKIRL